MTMQSGRREGGGEPPAFDFQQIEVLLVDDQPTMRAVVRRMLANLGVRRVVMAGNGAEGLDAIAHEQPDCVLSDIGMAPVNGLALLQAVRSGRAGAPRNLPIVMLTGHAERATVGAALALDVSGFLIKPVSAAQLSQRLARAVRQPLHLRDAALYEAVDIDILDLLPDSDARAPASAPVSATVSATARAPAADPAGAPPPGAARVMLAEVPDGAILARPIRASNGRLLLGEGHTLSRALLDRLSDVADLEGIDAIWVRR